MVMKVKTSIGIALCRKERGGANDSNNKISIVLIKKRITYSFTNFVHGIYNPRNKIEMIKLFDGMTLEEKREILSFNFRQLWYRIWGHSNVSTNYITAKTKYETNFLIGGTDKLVGLIRLSTNHAAKTWEIPKGRKKSYVEYDMNCAIREFQEETGITKQQYRILPNVIKTHTHIDNGVKYENIYFVAVPRGSQKINVRVSMGMNKNESHNNQLDEIADIRWVDIVEARILGGERLVRQLKPIFNIVKKSVDVISD